MKGKKEKNHQQRDGRANRATTTTEKIINSNKITN
jgi:hypothetical protein